MAQDDPKLNFTGLNSDLAARWQAGVPDANGHPPERHVTAAGTGPYRHCLGKIAGGKTYLILAHRPFPKPQPYAEVGPMFICAAPSARYDGLAVPPLFLGWRAIMIRGYGAHNRIVYGSGQVNSPRSTRVTAPLDKFVLHVRPRGMGWDMEIQCDCGSFRPSLTGLPCNTPERLAC